MIAPRPHGTKITVVLNEAASTVSVIVRFPALAVMLVGAVSAPAVTQRPSVPCEIVKSLAARSAVVRVVPVGKVRVMVLPEVTAVMGVKMVKSASLAWTNVPTVDPVGP